MTEIDEDECERCGAETPETEEDWESEGWQVIAGQELCRKCALEVLGQKRLFA